MQLLFLLLILSLAWGFSPTSLRAPYLHPHLSVKSLADGLQSRPTSLPSALFSHSKTERSARPSAALHSILVSPAPTPSVRLRPGRAHSAESRAKISAANKGKKPWNAGVKHSQATRDKIRAGVLRRLKEKGFVSKSKKSEGAKSKRGVPLSDEVKSKVRFGARGVKRRRGAKRRA